MKKTLAFGAVTAMIALTSACGGGRPTADELSAAIQEDDHPVGSVIGDALTEDLADCMAKVYVDSDLSDDTLNAMLEGDEDYKGSDEEKEKLTEVSQEAGTECAEFIGTE
ncbi:MAG: hypothetical protein QM621_07525 [Aeromicrobium sp.]|uniref:hypothetical protein n=1 Tax=Aeromicrobium sp. TaxID=1871063 RepID=UPI0039E63AB1